MLLKQKLIISILSCLLIFGQVAGIFHAYEHDFESAKLLASTASLPSYADASPVNQAPQRHTLNHCDTCAAFSAQLGAPPLQLSPFFTPIALFSTICQLHALGFITRTIQNYQAQAPPAI